MSLMLSYQKAIRAARAVGREVELSAVPSPAAGKSLLAERQRDALVASGLAEDLEALHGVVSIDRKIAIKRDTLIPKYAGYVARLREAGRPHELIGYFLVWLFDCGLIERALDLAGWCAEHGQGLPERFKASLPAFVARQILDWSQQAFDEGASPEPFFSQVYARLFDPDPALAWDVHDDVAAQFLRLRGLMLERAGDVPGAVAELEKALARGAKVKTALDKLKKKSGA